MNHIFNNEKGTMKKRRVNINIKYGEKPRTVENKLGAYKPPAKNEHEKKPESSVK